MDLPQVLNNPSGFVLKTQPLVFSYSSAHIGINHSTFESIRTNFVNGKLTVNQGLNQNSQSFRDKWTNAIFKAFHSSRPRSTPGIHLEWVTIFVLTFVIARLAEETSSSETWLPSVNDEHLFAVQFWSFIWQDSAPEKKAFYESYSSKQTPPYQLYKVFFWILLFSYLFRKHRRFKAANPFKHTK